MDPKGRGANVATVHCAQVKRENPETILYQASLEREHGPSSAQKAMDKQNRRLFFGRRSEVLASVDTVTAYKIPDVPNSIGSPG